MFLRFLCLFHPLLPPSVLSRNQRHKYPGVRIKKGFLERKLTVAGPMMVTPLWSAFLISFLVRASGMPSAMMAMVRI